MPKQGRRNCGLPKTSAGGRWLLVHQPLLAVKIEQHGVQQGGALGDGLFNLRPFVFRNHQGDGIQRQGALIAPRIVRDVVGDAGFPDQLHAGLPVAIELPEAHAPDGHRKLAPVAAREAGRQQRLIPVALEGGA